VYSLVAATVERMVRPHRSYDEIDSPGQMRADAAATGRALRLDHVVRAATAGAPSLDYADFPRDVSKREIAVDDAAARIANALNLYLD
jgi:hypothetical protein